MKIDLNHRSAFSGTASIKNPVLLFNGYVDHLNASVPLHFHPTLYDICGLLKKAKCVSLLHTSFYCFVLYERRNLFNSYNDRYI